MMLKAFIGLGILELPHATSKVGLAIAFPVMAITALLSYLGTARVAECMLLLRPSSPKAGFTEVSVIGSSSESVPSSTCSISSERSNISSETSLDSDTESVLEESGLGPLAHMAKASLGTWALVLAILCGITAQCGMCIAYIDAMTEILYNILVATWSFELVPSSIQLAVSAACALISAVRSVKNLAWLSLVALLTYCFIGFFLLYFGCKEFQQGRAPESDLFLPPKSEKNLLTAASSFYGTCIFAFEGIFVAQHLIADMNHTKHGMDVRPFQKALMISYIICFCAYLFFASFGFASYGRHTQQIIYHNFPQDSFLVIICELISVLVLLVSFALQMYPVFSLLDRHVIGMKPCCLGTSWGQLAIAIASRECLVLVLMAGSFAIPNAANMTGIVGSFSLATLGFVLPGLCHGACCLLKGLQVPFTDFLLVLAGLAAIVMELLSIAASPVKPQISESFSTTPMLQNLR